jgi:hypothetical protein
LSFFCVAAVRCAVSSLPITSKLDENETNQPNGCCGVDIHHGRIPRPAGEGGSFFSAPEPLPPQALVRQAQPSPVDPARPATYKRAAMSSSGDSHGADGAEAEEDDRALLETVLRRVERSVRLAAETGGGQRVGPRDGPELRQRCCLRPKDDEKDGGKEEEEEAPDHQPGR